MFFFVLAIIIWPNAPVLAGTAQTTELPARLSAGRQHSALLLQDGSLYLWGDNTFGQLGVDDIDYLDEPRLVNLPGKALDVSLGSDHTLVLLDDASVYAMGRNTFGQLGNQSTNNSSLPVKVEGLPEIASIAAGAWHSLALGVDGSVWGWGDNSAWQLGEPYGQVIRDVSGNIIGYRHISPQRLVLDGAVKIAAGGQFSLYIRQDSQLLAWGDNSRGQLGDGTNQARSRPTVVTGLHSVRDLSAGFHHVLTVVSDQGKDVLYTWGDHTAGQLGLTNLPPGDIYLALPQRLDPSDLSDRYSGRIALLSAGYAHAMVVIDVQPKTGDSKLKRQQILVWGDNSYGQLSFASPQLLANPVPVAGIYNGFAGQDFSPFAALACGGFHSLLLSGKGLLAASGRGDRGQLGTQSVINRSQFTPVTIPDLIRPGWADTAALAVTRLADDQLQLRWPAAQDNIRVAGYRLVLQWSDGTTHIESIGLTQTWTSAPGFLTGKDDLALHAGIYVYDEASSGLPVAALSRLLSFLPPLNQPDADLEAHFAAPVQPAHLIDAEKHIWRPGSGAPVQPPVVPWDISAVYAPDELPEPPVYSLLIILAAAALLLSLAAIGVFCVIRRKNPDNRRSRAQLHINIRRVT